MTKDPKRYTRAGRELPPVRYPTPNPSPWAKLIGFLFKPWVS